MNLTKENSQKSVSSIVKSKIRNRQKSINNRELLIVASEGKLDEVKNHIDEGADVNFVDGDGNTALHYATESGNLEVVYLLLDKTKDVSVENNQNMTPLNIAREKKKQDIIEKIEEKILDNSFKMLENLKTEPPSPNVVNKRNLRVEQDIKEKIKKKVEFCLKALDELVSDTSNIKKFTHKNVNIFVLFLEAFALQDVEINNNLSKDEKDKFIEVFLGEKDYEIIKHIRDAYIHRENKIEDKRNVSSKVPIVTPEYLQNFVVSNNKQVNVGKFFHDLRDYVQGVYDVMQVSEWKLSKKQSGSNRKNLGKILKKSSNSNRKNKTKITVLELFGNLVKEAYSTERQQERAEEIMFNLIVNIIPLIGKDFKEKFAELKSLRDNLIHNFHHYNNVESRTMELKKALRDAKSNLFKYHFSTGIHDTLKSILGRENFESIKTKLNTKLEDLAEQLKQQTSLTVAAEEANSLEYTFEESSFPNKDNQPIEALVEQYFKFMIIIDHMEIERKEQLNNDDEGSSNLKPNKELSDVERREIFEDFMNLKKMQGWSDNECRKFKRAELRKKLVECGITEDDFDNIVKSYVEDNSRLDQKAEYQAKKVVGVITVLMNLLHGNNNLSIRDVIYLYKRKVSYLGDYENLLKKRDLPERIKQLIKTKLDNLPDGNEILNMPIAGKPMQISVSQIVINAFKIFYNPYNKYRIEFVKIERLFYDDVFLDYLISRDVERINSRGDERQRFQFRDKNYICVIIKKLIKIEYMAPYIASLITKVQSDEAIEKDDLLELIEILSKEDLFIPYLSELLHIKSTESSFCFYEEICNIILKNEKTDINIESMEVVFKEPEHVKGILAVLHKKITSQSESLNRVVELTKKILELLNNVILDLFYELKFKRAEGIVNLEEIGSTHEALKKQKLLQDSDSIAVGYALNAAKVTNFRGVEEENQNKFTEAKQLYKKALEFLEGVSATNSPQFLLVLSRKAYIKRLLKKYDASYKEYEDLYKKVVEFALHLDLNALPRDEQIYDKEIYVEITKSESYLKLLAISKEHAKYLNVINIRSAMAYNKICSKNYGEAIEIYKEIYNIEKYLGEESKSIKRTMKSIAKINSVIGKNKAHSGDYQSALEHYYDSLEEYIKVLTIEKKKYSNYHPIIKSTSNHIQNLLHSIAAASFKIGELESSNNGEKALKHYEKVLKINEQLYELAKSNVDDEEEEEEHTLKVLGRFEKIYSKISLLVLQNDQTKALECYDKMIELNENRVIINKRIHGENSEEVKRVQRRLENNRHWKEALVYSSQSH